MDFRFTEEQEELREMARAFLDEVSGSEAVRAAMASDLGYDAEVWKRLGTELGWPSVNIPEAYGGLGLGDVELVALMEPMGESLLCSPFFSTLGLGANAILVAGSEEQKQEWLPSVAEGATILSLAYAESEEGGDPARLHAEFRSEGDDVVLNGKKRFVVDGHSADQIIVVARAQGTSGAEGIGLFLVPGDTVGLTRTPLSTMDQTRRLADLEMSELRLPSSARLGEAGAAELAETLQRASIALAAEQIGGAQRCLDTAVEYAKERVQYGRVIGSFQSIKHKCADMMVKIESARSAVYYAACVAAEGGDDLPVAAAMAKSSASDAYFFSAGSAMQIFGGVGFTWEYDVHLYFKRARSSSSLLGDVAFHRELVARGIGL